MKQTAFILFLFACLAWAAPSHAHSAHKGAPQATAQEYQEADESPDGCACGRHQGNACGSEAAVSETGNECKSCGHSKGKHGKSAHGKAGGHCCCCDDSGGEAEGYIPVPVQGEQRLVACIKEAADIFICIPPAKAAMAESSQKGRIRDGSSTFSKKWYTTVLSMTDDEEDAPAALRCRHCRKPDHCETA